MKITSIGHSCFLLEMAPASGDRDVRILGDAWLSDYLIGDLQGRYPRIKIAPECFTPLDAVFLSHSHTDHLDPYALVELWKNAPTPPALLLPESMRYLESLLSEYLPGSEVVFLQHDKPVSFRGLELKAFFNPETGATNEDDVMVLTVRNDHELFVNESDAVLPFYHPMGRYKVQELIGNMDVETLCFHCIRNEGEATMSMLAARSLEDRQARLGQSIERTYEEIHEIFAPHDEIEEDLWYHERVVRLVAGQGICYPQKVDARWNNVLFPIRREDRVRMEREVAAEYGCPITIEDFEPGWTFDLQDGGIASRMPARGLEVLDAEGDRQFDPELELFENFPDRPIRDESRDSASQRQRILKCLNERFLPHLIGARNPPIEHILGEGGGEYRIRVRLGTSTEHEECDFQLTFENLVFHEAACDGRPDEYYWANDIEDVLDGTADEFSAFCRHPLPAPQQRFWLSFGLPYLNNDLIEKKLRYHFERASQGESLEDWILSFYS